MIGAGDTVERETLDVWGGDEATAAIRRGATGQPFTAFGSRAA